MRRRLEFRPPLFDPEADEREEDQGEEDFSASSHGEWESKCSAGA